ncbi:hypothetical protein FOA43_001091 [Brettanomyces nanus]|uniref:Electron transfer flavoprotein-ubiquinone oxidoreductase n=1 Tax=Eeniella nana TaxID=13502 RepID=A0A875RTR4_EENNA|nr:uncharacterized protein FOA43_001091 [Brettanomyces nanus]QPG73777.1 hypothetical protein FOA43_001091 [Brettanomyces nanus]
MFAGIFRGFPRVRWMIRGDIRRLVVVRRLRVSLMGPGSTRLYGLRRFSTSPKRFSEIAFESLGEEQQEMMKEERVVDNVDICIVGGGPSGLATAIRLKQLDKEDQLRVVVLEKGAEIGAHILSGAILEPRALRELFPKSEYYDDQGKGIPLPADLVSLVKEEHMKLLFKNGYSIPLPGPPQMANKGRNYVASLSEVVKWMGDKAESIGVEVYPNTSVSSLIYDSKGAVKGVATKDMGVGKDSAPTDDFERGMEFHSKLTVLAEGCRGSISKQAISQFHLSEGKSHQTYGIGVKEVWEVKPENFRKGYIAHTMGYPLDRNTYGGGFQYHFGDGLVTVGLVVGLDYENPWISPYQEFQKMKMHPFYKKVLKGGKCISYGARALNEGGYQAVPRLHFPGGVIVGASAGFMNVPKIKGSHTAIKSGMLAAEAMYPEVLKVKKWVEEKIAQDCEQVQPVEKDEKDEDDDDDDDMIILPEWKAINLSSLQTAYENSWIKKELFSVRNVRPSFHNPLGFWGGIVCSGLFTMITRGHEPFTLKFGKTDSELVMDASSCKKIDYPKPDGKITFDILTSVSRTGTYHKENEKCHLRVPEQDLKKHADKLYPKFQGIEQRFCPAGVYEYVPDEKSKLGVKFQINSQNCIHCKTCDIKIPTQDITWTVPEGGDGPKYQMT